MADRSLADLVEYEPLRVPEIEDVTGQVFKLIGGKIRVALAGTMDLNLTKAAAGELLSSATDQGIRCRASGAQTGLQLIVSARSPSDREPPILCAETDKHPSG
ncbi:hypothetical protein [Aquamicrobium sp. LC103]|uniref:hypothetical protein n=1 Tax=Aquamicrobium sp. LC103 TaxID=1120658 RepID=UPI001FED6C49|nr:hypothetical protein [Aquamicrobium sp. LC103]